MAAKDWDGDDDIKGLWVAAAADEREKLVFFFGKRTQRPSTFE